ncbi:hypothetical protein LMG27952_06178 [Paraburkholderia hiiakae]|uniref:Uncharacterized protein n=1 Tax=Paraburkholderia hiiakae TaxID=1081782 RepID=A0ABM8P5B3_9BURK|nr:hypothetical protein LMG27952_06178 [Paraburkholderia hiiakae]
MFCNFIGANIQIVRYSTNVFWQYENTEISTASCAAFSTASADKFWRIHDGLLKYVRDDSETSTASPFLASEVAR